ncbi:hypothetical protein AAFF_G00140860 [Aldrovandia affinis]|uniref:Uncharacterized protein n=1 Tax=Aldrovandia affinis TaxID=143900 RepID=A0AAD7X2S4_9TELE|nr:hypothetical protein AAFF_G00140860 [Aldrovandia affinis]
MPHCRRKEQSGAHKWSVSVNRVPLYHLQNTGMRVAQGQHAWFPSAVDRSEITGAGTQGLVQIYLISLSSCFLFENLHQIALNMCPAFNFCHAVYIHLLRGHSAHFLKG